MDHSDYYGLIAQIIPVLLLAGLFVPGQRYLVPLSKKQERRILKKERRHRVARRLTLWFAAVPLIAEVRAVAIVYSHRASWVDHVLTLCGLVVAAAALGINLLLRLDRPESSRS